MVLSAQCTDRRVNIVTEKLFEKYPTAKEMAKVSENDILKLISSISYPNSKSRYLKGLSDMLVNQYGGEVPCTMEELIKLPGVGRKTANVILAVVFKKSALAVDTHVFRVSHRLGLVPKQCSTPLAVEMELKKHIDSSLVAQAHFWLLYFGRYTCTAQRPLCNKCGLKNICKINKTKNEHSNFYYIIL